MFGLFTIVVADVRPVHHVVADVRPVDHVVADVRAIDHVIADVGTVHDVVADVRAVHDVVAGPRSSPCPDAAGALTLAGPVADRRPVAARLPGQGGRPGLGPRALAGRGHRPGHGLTGTGSGSGSLAGRRHGPGRGHLGPGRGAPGRGSIEGRGPVERGPRTASRGPARVPVHPRAAAASLAQGRAAAADSEKPTSQGKTHGLVHGWVLSVCAGLGCGRVERGCGGVRTRVISSASGRISGPTVRSTDPHLIVIFIDECQDVRGRRGPAVLQDAARLDHPAVAVARPEAVGEAAVRVEHPGTDPA